jgi:hypothetical protein
MPINYKQYPYNWKNVIVPQIRARSKDKCETCGIENGTTVYSIQVKKWNGKKWVYRREWYSDLNQYVDKYTKPVRVVLTVAHKNHDHSNHKVKLEDLIHECQKCHLRRDAYMKARRRVCGKWCSFPDCNKGTCLDLQPR